MTTSRLLNVIDAARDAVAILEGNHPAGDFVDPASVAGDVIRAALIAHDAEPVDGGCAWDNTIGGLTVYASNGQTAAIVKPGYYPASQEEKRKLEALVSQLAELLGLATFPKVKEGAQ